MRSTTRLTTHSQFIYALGPRVFPPPTIMVREIEAMYRGKHAQDHYGVFTLAIVMHGFYLVSTLMLMLAIG